MSYLNPFTKKNESQESKLKTEKKNLEHQLKASEGQFRNTRRTDFNKPASENTIKQIRNRLKEIDDIFNTQKVPNKKLLIDPRPYTIIPTALDFSSSSNMTNDDDSTANIPADQTNVAELIQQLRTELQQQNAKHEKEMDLLKQSYIQKSNQDAELIQTLSQKLENLNTIENPTTRNEASGGVTKKNPIQGDRNKLPTYKPLYPNDNNYENIQFSSPAANELASNIANRMDKMMENQKHHNESQLKNLQREYLERENQIRKSNQEKMKELESKLSIFQNANSQNTINRYRLGQPPILPRVNLIENENKPRKTFLERLKLIPIFNGDSYKKLQEFVGVANTLFASISNSAENDEFIQTIFLQLRNEAQIIIDYENPVWENIKENLLHQFSHLLNREIINSTLENLRQKSTETLTEYAERARKCLNDKINSYQFLTNEQREDYDRVARKSFARGLHEKTLRERVINYNSKSLNGAISYAIDMENENVNTISNNELFCKFCKNSGHRERDCRRKQSQNGIGQLISALQSLKPTNQNRQYSNNYGNNNQRNYNNQYQNNQNWNNNRYQNHNPNNNYNTNPQNSNQRSNLNRNLNNPNYNQANRTNIPSQQNRFVHEHNAFHSQKFPTNDNWPNNFPQPNIPVNENFFQNTENTNLDCSGNEN